MLDPPLLSARQLLWSLASKEPRVTFLNEILPQRAPFLLLLSTPHALHNSAHASPLG